MRLFRSASLTFIAGALAFVQVADHLHLALRQHEVCAEHGELVEAATPVAHRLIDPLDGVETHIDLGETSSITDADHAHCLVSLWRRSTVGPQAALTFEAPPPATQATEVERPSPGVASTLHLAPKQSPPV